MTTCPDNDLAGRIARSLVEQKLAACVNCLPAMRSIYLWQGKIEDDEEILLIAKTIEEKLQKLEACVSEMHPYELPEMLTVPISSGSEAYLNWIRQSLQ